jgi:hypothetical protein
MRNEFTQEEWETCLRVLQVISRYLKKDHQKE